MKTPVRWHYGSITHSWLQLPPRYDRWLVPLLQLLKKARLHKPRGRCRKRLWPSQSCAASRHREALVDSRAIWTTARSVCVRFCKRTVRQATEYENENPKDETARAIPLATGSQWAIDWVCLDPGADYFSSRSLFVCAFVYLPDKIFHKPFSNSSH